MNPSYGVTLRRNSHCNFIITASNVCVNTDVNAFKIQNREFLTYPASFLGMPFEFLLNPRCMMPK